MRRVRVKDPTGKTLIFLTNNTALPAPVIAQLYKNRWQVELFFKWITKHSRIKKFLGTSENAVKAQIWCAISTYVLIAIGKKGVATEILPLHLSTDFVGLGFRENSGFMPLAGRSLAKRVDILGWCYFVTTVGRDEEVICTYIQLQETEDERLDQLALWKKPPPNRWHQELGPRKSPRLAALSG